MNFVKSIVEKILNTRNTVKHIPNKKREIYLVTLKK